MSTPTISLPLHGPPISSAHQFLSLSPKPVLSTSSAPESALLSSIRVALRGTGTDHISTIHSTLDARFPEDELTWDAYTVVLSTGGVIRKKWNFEEEGQAIQWACSSFLEQDLSTLSGPSHNSAHYTSEPPPPPPPQSPSERSTFGPFSGARAEHNRRVKQEIRVPAVFVFLRSIGKIYLENGMEYTFSLPFIVRKAWPLHPHGVMIQRVLEPSEREEAELTDDLVLPTIFSLTSPFAEASAVGLTSGIVGGGRHLPISSLKDEDENSRKPLVSIPPSETVIWASHRAWGCLDDLVVTIDLENHQLSIWRYTYLKPKDIPVPLGRGRARSIAQKRKSMSGYGSRRSSTLFSDAMDRRDPLHAFSPHPRSREQSPSPEFPEFPEFPDLPPLSALPGMAPTLTSTTTMESLVPGVTSQSGTFRDRRNSRARHDLSVTMDRMVLGARMEGDTTLAPIEHGRMKAAYWMERIHTQDISENDTHSWRHIQVALFDERWDGQEDRALFALCLPASETLDIFTLTNDEQDALQIKLLTQLPAISAVTIKSTRELMCDLLVVKPNHQMAILTHGIRELPVEVHVPRSEVSHDDVSMDTDNGHLPVDHGGVVCVEDSVDCSATVHFEDGWCSRATFNFMPLDELTYQSLLIMSHTLPADVCFDLHKMFIEIWSTRGFGTSDGVEFDCFAASLFKIFHLNTPQNLTAALDHSWDGLVKSSSYNRFRDDVALRHLKMPPRAPPPRTPRYTAKPHRLLAPVLYALHTLGEDLRLQVHRYQALLRLAPAICKIAFVVRPEWADYWKRLCPEIDVAWPSPSTTVIAHLDDRIPVWPPDISAILYGRISNPDWKVPWNDAHDMSIRFGITPCFIFGRASPLTTIPQLTDLYMSLADNRTASTQKRAENAMALLVQSDPAPSKRLPLGVAAPLREAARTCQLAPPGDWPLEIYRAIGRNDLAASAMNAPDMLFNDRLYRPVKDYLNPSHGRKTINDLVSAAKASGGGEVDAVSGVELDLEDFTDIRFGQDRRLEEVARMLCSSTIPSIKMLDHPEVNEHEHAKEYQHQVVRIAERTLALPYGRAMFTFGCIPTVTREAYAIPKIEFTIRLQPLNITAAPEPGKIPPECLNWGEFHNGVAAGLRISPTAIGVESSWIAFNKPSELTPEHAGFLYALGLTGHLREMLTWHTFAYLTPKHDLTSIGVLLGLSAANVGTGNQHVTKLLAVHTPALLPTPTVDLNVSLMTQAAGLTGVGLLYMGMKNRRMAEVCLSQISRKDLVQPDLSNEHREAYTYSAALAFGMIMLGKGSSIPADMDLLSRLNVLIHGAPGSLTGMKTRPPFDLNLTSPAATIALGLMYLRTERRDIADMLTVPETVLELNRIQPSFLLMRSVARSLIMWEAVAPTPVWLTAQIPPAIHKAMELRFKGAIIDDALELAYYNILAGCCFIIGLKYAGTARQEAYLMIISYFDLFSRLVYSNGPAFDHKIKRSAVREGLNLISISLSMVMAGTGEITCLRRLRYAYGMYHQSFRYGIHVATHMSLGLLFLGGGRFTLGTSDAAIACMITAFFPRSHHVSSDNKSYLQALRHLWVLAVEPRCLIARDVDTQEVVYLPVKITMREGNEVGTTQLIAPTLIPDLDKLLSIRVDTPRYWPFYLDTEKIPRHKENLLRSQTLYVKRRTAFLSYTEDPRGSRSLFVRSGSSAGDAATLDFPQLTDAKTHPAGDLSEFITSFSNDILFLAFADHFSREDGETDEERVFHAYCHASLLDSILQDKPQTLQSHLTLYRYRTMSPSSRFFHLRLQDLRFAADFYSRIYDRRFSGRTENNSRPPLVRDTTVSGALHALDLKLEAIRKLPWFIRCLTQYARGQILTVDNDASQSLAWYLLRNGVPVSTLLVILKELARDAHAQCMGIDPPEGTLDGASLDQGIKEVLHATGTKMTTALGSGWSVRSLEDILDAWKRSV